jgi:hypothetical protein
VYNKDQSISYLREGKLKTNTNLRLRFTLAILALIVANLACGRHNSTQGLITNLTEDFFLEEILGERVYDIEPPPGAVNDPKCLPEISSGSQRTIKNEYMQGFDSLYDHFAIQDGNLSLVYYRVTSNIFCRATDAKLYECLEFQPDGYDLRVYSEITALQDQFDPSILCYSLNFRQALPATTAEDDPDPQAEDHDACDLSAYLDLQIEVTQNFVNEFNTHLCDYSVYFNNTHTELAGIPIIKVHQLDCFQDLDTYSYWALDSVQPGGQTVWTLGATSDHDDEDCPSRISGWFLVLAGMIVDDEPCVQAYLRSNAFREGYTEQVGFPVSAPPADCPLP